MLILFNKEKEVFGHKKHWKTTSHFSFHPCVFYKLQAFEWRHWIWKNQSTHKKRIEICILVMLSILNMLKLHVKLRSFSSLEKCKFNRARVMLFSTLQYFNYGFLQTVSDHFQFR